MRHQSQRDTFSKDVWLWLIPLLYSTMQLFPPNVTTKAPAERGRARARAGEGGKRSSADENRRKEHKMRQRNTRGGREDAYNRRKKQEEKEE